ncbi:MAG: peptidoglycan-binding protein [Rhizonema sp. PD38]|nr:peptidoglycan-binding protein [Rhizonema sp. PD38]
MRLRYSSIIMITCLTHLGVDASRAGTPTHDQASESIRKLTFASSTDTQEQSILELGSTGVDVKVLQTRLKKLGYYNGEVDGQYGESTRYAVAKFQQAKDLIADGITGSQTINRLQQVAVKKDTPASITPIIEPTNAIRNKPSRGLVWWSLVGVGVLGSIGALLYFVSWLLKLKKGEHTQTADTTTSHQNDLNPVIGTTNNPTTPPPTELLPSETTSRLTKVNIVDELIEDLRSFDPIQRRKAIWDLGQQGDSRAIQPLVELMMNADSQQRSLILAALSEIGIRTLKPMNHALAISLQDESSQVRQNAIRDLTRVYDMMAQLSQMLSHAAHDPDAEVQATARYALSQMNRIRALPDSETQEERGDKEKG